MRCFLLFISASLLTPSCGGGNDAAPGNGDSDPNGDPLPLTATYRVVSHTRNESACDQEGPDIQGGFPFFRLEERTSSDLPAVVFFPCNQIDRCDLDPTDGWVRDETSGTWGMTTEGLSCHCPIPCSGDCCRVSGHNCLDFYCGVLCAQSHGRIS